ncbi:MAG TPA: thioredoxin family protein [Kiritimatiellia bacterium]|nr:thioredoxin family protein [Kiritimatiellia bacterium]HRU69804.1 thioredoxin family protein [Kiritimatiellia bacterium]
MGPHVLTGWLHRIRRGVALMACLSAATSVCAQSPFGLKVERLALVDEQADVRITLSVPSNHVVYAASFQVSAAPLKVPAPEQKPDPVNPAQQVGVYAHPFESRWRVAPLRDGTTLTVAYQGCDDTVCFMPEEHVFRYDAASGRFVAVADAPTDVPPAMAGADAWAHGFAMAAGGGYMNADAFLAFLDRAEGAVDVADASGTGLAGFLGDPVAFFHAHGLFLTLLLVLLGGVLLNLTPCVLPMIPINLAILGAGAGTRGRGFGLGAAYGAGIVLVYGGLGWIILRSGIFFGALQASPWFNLVIGLIFVALTLALFDVLVIDFTRFATPKNGSDTRQGALAAFSAGALSALLAGACVAPVVLAVLLLAGSLYAGGAHGAQFLPFVLGLGMALPWPFAGAGLSVLPSPGMWMVRVKQAFGVLLALLAAYYLYLAVAGFWPSAQIAREGSITAGDRAAWDAKVEQARREGKPLFVDFWATWCKNCAVMEKTTFREEQVKQRLARYVVVKVQAERPERSPAKEMLDAFGIRGLPGFVVLRPDAERK